MIEMNSESTLMDFNEALRRIANTPKDSIAQKDNKEVVNGGKKVYNKKEAAKKPPPSTR